MGLNLNILASKRIHTRTYPDPNPPEIVDNPESILRKSPVSRDLTIISSIHRANYVPENLLDLQEIQVDLDFPSKLPRTKSLNAIDQTDFEHPISPQHSGQHISSRENPPSTPPDIHFIHKFGFSHPKSTQ